MTRINRAGHHRAERHRAAVIKIRYRDVNELSPGLHAMAERRGRVITVYVIPGLTAPERNAALRRLRLSGRRGYGPRLPAVPLAFARSADRIRTTVARAGSVFRTHPAGATGPVMLMSAGAIAFLVLSAVSVRILREPRAPAGPSASSLAPAGPGIGVRVGPGIGIRLGPGAGRHHRSGRGVGVGRGGGLGVPPGAGFGGGRFARARAIAGRSRHRDRRCLPGRGADRDLPGRLATSRTAMR